MGEETTWEIELGRLRRWKDNIKMDICEAGYEDGRWMEMANGSEHTWCHTFMKLSSN